MELEALAPRHLLPVGLLALLPVVWFGLGRSTTAGIVSGVNVLLIIASLYVAFEPVPGRHDHDDEHDSNGTSS